MLGNHFNCNCTKETEAEIERRAECRLDNATIDKQYIYSELGGLFKLSGHIYMEKNYIHMEKNYIHMK